MYLRLASLGQVYNIDPIVVEILHAAVKVLPQESAGLSGQRDPAETQLLEGEETESEKAAEGKTLANKTHCFKVVNLIPLLRATSPQYVAKICSQHHRVNLKHCHD